MDDLAILNDFSNDELEVLVKIIIEKGGLTEFLSTDETYKLHYPNHRRYVEKIKEELLDFGSHSFWRRVSYRGMLIDVCKKTKTPFNKNAEIERIENNLLETVLTDAWETMSDAEKEELLGKDGGKFCGAGGLAAGALIAMFRAGGFYSYRLAVIIANSMAKFILGRGLPFVANAALGRGLAILAGPVGWLITTLWFFIDIGGPAYRVTVPAVIYIAALRQVHCSQHYKDTSSLG